MGIISAPALFAVLLVAPALLAQNQPLGDVARQARAARGHSAYNPAANASANTSTPLEAARTAAQINMRTPEGRDYDRQIASAFGRKYAAVLAECTQAAGVDLDNFDIFLRLDADGSVKEVLSSPATKVAVCLRQKLLKDEFPAPPGPSYWARIKMVIR